jgi:hypothetical protein
LGRTETSLSGFDSFSRDALAPPPAVSVHLPAVAAYDALLLAGMELTP